MFRFRSKRLRENLTNIRNQWAGKQITGRISVPPELQWWYFHEFGTATHLGGGQAGGAIEPGITMQPVAGSQHPEGYAIPPKLKNYLSWPTSAGGHYFDWIIGERGYRFYVPWHPGVEQKAFVRSVLVDIRIQAVDKLAYTMLKSGFSLPEVRNALINEVMPTARDMIAASMSEHLTGTREDGKLTGQSADSVFRAQSFIQDLST